MIRAVWSFWARPFYAFYNQYWTNERTHLLAWTLSVAEASRHYPETALHADERGAEILVDRLALPFRHVSTSLEALNGADVDQEWWVLGKLSAYAAQTVPFVHLDSDVFLWKRLPSRLERAAVFAQNPERFVFEDQSLYRIDAFMRGIRAADGWLPPAWLRHAYGAINQAICCGILGGNDVRFLNRYANNAMEVVRHPANQAVWPTLGVRDNILVEQYFLAASLRHQTKARVRETLIRPEFLFPSSTDAFDPNQAEAAGFTHLIGDAKADTALAERLERRVRRDHPLLYERCIAYLAEA